MLVFFFFQAEDGIRDWSVTGVQTCALPICLAACLGQQAFFQHLGIGQALLFVGVGRGLDDARLGQALFLMALGFGHQRSEEHTSELQSLTNLVCRLLLEKKKKNTINTDRIRESQIKYTTAGYAFSLSNLHVADMIDNYCIA